MANRVSVLIDVATGKAVSQLKNFRTAVSDAHGFTGKLKAGVSSLGSTFKSAAANPAVMAGAVAAAGTAALKAVDAFADLGIRVGKFADATGLSAEESSRWVEVADDVGVSTDSLEKTLGKLGRSIDPKLFADLGIEIAKTKSGATDINGTFLNVIDRLNGMTDPAKKAEAAQKLLGRGWQDMAELIGQGSAALKQSLAEVSDAKVIDPAEVEKARRYRKAMDELGDAVQDIAITIGEELIPAVTEAAGPLKTLIGLVQKLGLVQKAADLATPWGAFGAAVEAASSEVDYSKMSLEELQAALKSANVSAKDAAAITEKWAEANGVAADSLAPLPGQLMEIRQGQRQAGEEGEEYRQTLEDQAAAAAEAEDALEGLLDASLAMFDSDIAARKAADDLTEAVGALAAAADDPATAIDELRQAQDEAASSALRLAEADVRRAEEMAKAAGGALSAADKNAILITSLSNVAASLAPGSPLRQQLEAYIRQLQSLPANKTTTITTNFVQTGKAGGFIQAGAKKSSKPGVVATAASGTKSAKRGVTLVGEEGEELVFMNGGEQVIPADETRRMLNADPLSFAPITGGGGTVDDRPIVIQLQLNDRTVQELTVRQKRLSKGTR